MFTGIIEEIGTVDAVKKGKLSASLRIRADKVLTDVKLGDSINTNGVCLTVTGFDKNGFEVDAVAETMRLTNLGRLTPGSKVNLERALRLSDRLGGHMVSGHVDGTGNISSVEQEENATWITIHADNSITRYLIKKGSVALDGISLTVARTTDHGFSVAIIPHTGDETTLLQKKPGDLINIECDIQAKYLEKFLMEDKKKKEGSINYNYLTEHGFID